MVAFGQAQTDVLFAVGLLAAFALGHCGVIVAAGTAVQRAQDMISWGGRSPVTRWIRRAWGGLVFLAGVYLLVK